MTGMADGSGAWRELRESESVGPLTTQLVYRTVRAVARRHRFPPPDYYETWKSDAVTEVAHEFLLDLSSGGTLSAGRLSRLVAQATDEASFGRLLHKTVLNYLRQQARGSARGAVLEQLRHALGRIDGVEKTPSGAWSLEQCAGQLQFAGDPSELVDAAYGVDDVRFVRWNSDTRRSPLAESDSLRRVLLTVLAAAAAPVSESVMVEVAIARFPLAIEPSPMEFKDENTAYPDQVSAEAVGIAQEIWDQLSSEERVLLAVPDLTVREVAGLFGVGKSTVDRRRRSINNVIESYGPQQATAEVIGILRRAAAFLEFAGTPEAGSSSLTSEEA